jgi:hypothetical protein
MPLKRSMQKRTARDSLCFTAESTIIDHEHEIRKRLLRLVVAALSDSSRPYRLVP